MDNEKKELAVELNYGECTSLADFIENNLLDIIRRDIDIENVQYVANLIHIWERCSGVISKKKLEGLFNGGVH